MTAHPKLERGNRGASFVARLSAMIGVMSSVGVMRSSRMRRWTGIVALLALLAACAGPDPSVEAVGPDELTKATEDGGEWVRHTMGSVAADREILGEPTANGAAVLTVEEPGHVRAFTFHSDGSMSEASVEAGSSELRMVTGIVDGPAGLIATGNDVPSEFANFVLVSRDGGATWTETPTVGLEVPMDVLDLAATPDGYVAVGTLRTADDPSRGGFEPAIFTSGDGLSWSRSETPPGSEGMIRSVVAADDELLAAGRVDDSTTILRSSDGGTTWSEADDAPAAQRILASGTTLLAVDPESEDGGPDAMWRSDGGGTSWQSVDSETLSGFAFSAFAADPGGFAIVTSEADEDFSAERCYADIESCRSTRSVEDEVVLLSEDGRSWRRLDLAMLDGLFRPSSVLHNDSGDTIVLGTADDGNWAGWIWDAAQGPPPVAADPPKEEGPIYNGPPLVAAGSTLEVGERRAFQLYLHCGLEYLAEFNGAHWVLSEAPTGNSPETGAGDQIPDGWPVAGDLLFGFVTFTDEHRIEYSLEDGTVIAEYEPLPPGAEVPLCY